MQPNDEIAVLSAEEITELQRLEKQGWDIFDFPSKQKSERYFRTIEAIQAKIEALEERLNTPGSGVLSAIERDHLFYDIVNHGALDADMVRPIFDSCAALEKERDALKVDSARLDWLINDIQPDSLGDDEEDLREDACGLAMDENEEVQSDELLDRMYLKAVRNAIDKQLEASHGG